MAMPSLTALRHSSTGSWWRVDRPFGTRDSIEYTSDGCEAERLAFGIGFAAWTISSNSSLERCSLLFIVDSTASVARSGSPSGTFLRMEFSAASRAALRAFFVPKSSISFARCSRKVNCSAQR